MKIFLVLLALAIAIGCQSSEAGKVKKPKLPYPWTQWLAMKPAMGATAVAMAPQAMPYSMAGPYEDTSEEDSGDEEEDEAIQIVMRAIKEKELPLILDPTATTTKKPSIVDVPLDFWAAPTTMLPNATVPVPVVPPGFYAAKKSMFISKLFAALAKVVLNDTVVTTTTTPSPMDAKAALLDQIDSVLLSQVARAISESSPPVPKAKVATVPAVAEPTTVKPVKVTTPSVVKQKMFLDKIKASMKKAKKAKTTTEAPIDFNLLAKAFMSE